MASELEDALKSVEADEAAADANETEETETEVEAKAEADVKETEDSKETKGSKSTAQDRIRSLSGKVKTLSDQLGGLSDKLTARDQEIEKLVDLLQMREKDSKLIEKINELYETGPEDIRANIQRLNDVLMGVDTQIEEAKEQAKDAKEAGDKGALKEIKALQKELETTKSVLENQLTDQNDNMLLDKADQILERFFASLGDEYTEDDKRVLSEAVIDRINWEAIEEDNNVLQSNVADGFKKTLEWYGSPRGANKVSPTKEPGKPDISIDNLLKVEWGKTKDVSTKDGKALKAAEYSDDAFTQALAEAMRQGNKAR